MLEINIWDQNQYYTRADTMMDDLEKKLHRNSYMTARYLIRIFRGERQHILDPDKTIKKVQEQFEMHVYEKEGQS